jgi:hypothetical protein
MCEGQSLSYSAIICSTNITMERRTSLSRIFANSWSICSVIGSASISNGEACVGLGEAFYIFGLPSTRPELALFLLAEYWNYEKDVQLDTVCEAIPFADLLPFNPKTDLEKAQVICDARRDIPDMPDE